MKKCMHKIKNMPLQPPVLDQWANMHFSSNILFVVYILIFTSTQTTMYKCEPSLAVFVSGGFDVILSICGTSLINFFSTTVRKE